MKHLFTGGLLLFLSLSGRAVILPPTPLEPVYNALLNQQNPLAWQLLINLWPHLSSTTQRTAWLQALDAVISSQCGNDLPITVPDWLDAPTLVLIQRDIPLNRIYRVQFNGRSQRQNIQVSLIQPDGKEIILSKEVEYATDGQFRMVSDELSKALPLGVYRLRIRSGNEIWQTALALQGSGGLNWIQRQGQKIRLQPPITEFGCPAPWLEQTLLKRSDYNEVWRQKSDHIRIHPWPQRNDNNELWATISVVRIEARGGLTLRVEHLLAGPLLTMQN